MLFTHFVELAATYTECFLVLATSMLASGNTYRKKPLLFLTLTVALIPTIAVALLNQWQTFSYITPLAAMITIVICAQIISTGSLLIRSISCILSYLVIQCIDYIVVILVDHLIGQSEDFFHVFVSSGGANRVLFLVIDKSIDIAIFVLIRKQLPSLSRLGSHLCRYLLLLSAISYIVMQCLFQAVLLPSLSIMQLAVVASWCFLIGFIVAIVAFFLSLTRQQQDHQRMEMLRSENVLMAENYKNLHTAQQTNTRVLHDFKHHLATVQELLASGKIDTALHYLDSLLKTSYQQAAQCHSGNDIVDAIVNSKLSEAQSKDIQFTFAANLHIPVQIDPVDLCGILANQLENAFEACIQIPDPTKRLVHAEIKQIQSFVILRVENTVLSDPFINNPNLSTTKPASSVPHGFGLLNMKSIAQKYEGTLRTEFSDGKFISVVSLCDLPFDTNNSTVR